MDRRINGDKSGRTRVYRVANKAIDLYNRYRAPEAVAELVSVKEGKNGEAEVVVKFTGSFCHTCGIRDWVEDYAYTLDMMGYRAELKKYIEPENNDDYRIGVFRVKIDGTSGERVKVGNVSG